MLLIKFLFNLIVCFSEFNLEQNVRWIHVSGQHPTFKEPDLKKRFYIAENYPNRSRHILFVSYSRDRSGAPTTTEDG